MPTHRRGFVVRGVWLLGVAVALNACAEKVTAPPEPPASVRRGDRAFRDDKYRDAITAYRDYLVGHTASDPYTVLVIYKTALAEYRLRQYPSALATLGDLDQLYPARRWVQVEALRGDAEAGLNNRVAALEAWDVAWSVAGPRDLPKLRARVERLAAEMTPQQLAEARRAVASDALAAILDRQIAQGGAPRQEPAPVAAVPPPGETERDDFAMAEPPPEAPVPVAAEAGVDIDVEPEAEPAAAPPAPIAVAAVPPPGEAERDDFAMAEPPPEAPAPVAVEAVEVDVESEAEPPAVPPAPSVEAAAPPPDVPVSEELEFETEEPAPTAVAETPPDITDDASIEVAVPPEEQPVAAEEAASTPTVPAVKDEREVVLAETPRVGPAPTPGPEDRVLDRADVAVPVGADPRVACLLPLSGPDKSAGERALRGIRLVFPSDDSTLVLRDTGSIAALAGRLFEEVARDPAVVVVVGPPDAAGATVIAARAARLHMPTLLLAAGPAGPFALPLGVTAADEIARVLDYAVGSMRLRRFAVLDHTDASGSARATAFSQAVTRRGGTVIGTVPYAPGQPASMATYSTVRAWREKKDLQAVFVPDTSAGVARFAEGLESSMPDVTLLGVSGWERLAAGGDMPGVYGVLFADSFFAGSSRPATRDFVVRFEAEYGAPPVALEAEGFDVATLARAALDAGARSRGEFLRALRAVPGGRTASGEYRITPGGVERSLFLLQVSDGMVREVSSAADAE